ncbi:hypothetical protein M0804_003800 [Polistes exclamans]|nr:hypothetical protein M0804_003800 [Polistes exclamans]
MECPGAAAAATYLARVPNESTDVTAVVVPLLLDLSMLFRYQEIDTEFIGTLSRSYTHQVLRVFHAYVKCTRHLQQQQQQQQQTYTH